MTKTKFWLSILAISVVLIAGSLAASPIAIASDEPDEDDEPEEVIVVNTEPIPVTGSISSSPICPAENVQHWYSWNMTIGGDTQFIHPTLATLTTGILYNIKVSTSSDEVVEGSQAVSDHLTEIGYEAQNTITGVIGPIDPNTIGLFGLDDPRLYSTICAEN